MAAIEESKEPTKQTLGAVGPSRRTRGALKRAADAELQQPEEKILRCQLTAAEADKDYGPCTDPVLQTIAQTDFHVDCVALCDNKLFVASLDRLGAVLVYRITDERSYERLPDIVVNEMKFRTMSIVACTDSKQLYIASYVQRKHVRGQVWRVSLQDDNLVAIKWLPASSRPKVVNEFFPVYLSLSRQRLLVVASNKILVYGPDRAEVRRIEPNWNAIRGIGWAAETNRGTVVLNHHPQNISEINDDGTIVRQYSNESLTILSPWTAAFSPSGRLAVADNTDGRIIVLNERLELERVLLDEKLPEFAGPPACLCYVRGNGGTRQLVATFYAANTVQVWNVDI